MSVEVKVPSAGESISEVTLGDWAKKEGDAVSKDEILVQVETDKASVEIPAPASGTLEEILVASGEDASPGDVVARIADDADRQDDGDTDEDDVEAEAASTSDAEADEDEGDTEGEEEADAEDDDADADEDADRLTPRLTPAVRRALRRSGLDDPSEQDLLEALSGSEGATERPEETVKMSPLRRTIAKRLVEAQRRAALVTTFNEVDMSEVLTLRDRDGDRFERKHGVRLGIMSFFVKAVIEALKRFPGLNAEVRDDAIVYKRYYDIGVAVATDRGLVVPVLRDAHAMSFATIEKQIGDFAERANETTLEPEELEGGTFTISNGGVFGSLMSEPIVNPPQTGVLGMHAIEERPVARGGQVVVRPMMYLALTYDHRVIDGREAVQFLKMVAEGVESPARILLEL